MFVERTVRVAKEPQKTQAGKVSQLEAALDGLAALVGGFRIVGLHPTLQTGYQFSKLIEVPRTVAR